MEIIHYESFANLNKFKISLHREKATKIENVWWNATWLKVGIYTVTNIGVEMHNQIFILVKECFFRGNSEIWFNYRNDGLEKLKDKKEQSTVYILWIYTQNVYEKFNNQLGGLNQWKKKLKVIIKWLFIVNLIYL